MIQNKTKFIYSKHAKDEWIREERGIIRHYPKMFFLAGCKSCRRDGKSEDVYKVVYRYDDRYDLILVCREDGLVITNYLSLNLGNKTNFRGMFYLKPQKKLKNLLTRFRKTA